MAFKFFKINKIQLSLSMESFLKNNTLQLTSQSFSLPHEKISKSKIFSYIIVAYIFAIAVRLTAFIQVNQISAFWLEGKPVAIWSPDAGRYGYYAKSILEGNSLPYSADFLTGHLIASVSSMFGMSVEWVMLLLPLFLAGLIIIPIIWIGTMIKQPTLGFLAALFAVSESYFYSRTVLGYMDTDGVNLFLILMAIAFIIKLVKDKNILYALLASFVMQLFTIWYHSSSVINLLIIAISFVGILFYYRKDIKILQGWFLLAIVIIPLSVELKFALTLLVTILFLVITRYSQWTYKVYWYFGIVSVIIVGLFIDPNIYMSRALNYLSPDHQIVFSGKGIAYTYANDLLTVSEVKGSHLWNTGAPFPLTDVYIIIGILGYMLLVAFYPIMWFMLPLFVLGLLSSIAGARFSMYATPVLALGVSYMLYIVKNLLSYKYKKLVYVKRVPFYISAIILLMMIYNILIINMSAMLMASMYAPEAKAFNQFSKILKKDDMMISWWDYGWPLWYYTGKDQTLVDNGAHGGPDSYIVARIFLSEDQKYTYNATKIMSEARRKAPQNTFAVQYLAKEQNLTELFAPKLANKNSARKNNNDTYIILHYKMLDYFNVINKFSKINLENGKHGEIPQFVTTKLLKPFSENHSLLEGHAYILDSSDGMVLDAKEKKTPVDGLTIVKNNTRTKGYIFKHDNNITHSQVVVYRNKFIWLDQKLYDSFFIQAMLFDNYNHELFKKVAETSRIKIFKLK
jgi:hypothetical protein